MHKQISYLRLLLIILVALLFIYFLPGKSIATTDPDLVNSPQLDVQKSLDVNALPSSLNGNVDCIKDGPYNCVIDTSFGAYSSTGFVKRNKTSTYYELINNVENRARNIAIPNSGTIISYTIEPPYGFYLYFTKDFSLSTTLNTVYGTNMKQYQINKLYDGKLADKAAHRLAADYASMSFSSNGQWMVVSMPNVAMLRVNLDTFEVTPFATGFNYTIGLDPGIKTAISSDGRYVALSSYTFGRFEIYDLNSCGAVPNTINGPVSCQSKNLKTVMQQKVPGYIAVGQIRFVNNNTLRIYSNYNNGGGNKIAPFTIFPTGSSLHLQDYLAMGDSYISGEGAYNYLQGTDTADNKCHVSTISYPYLMSVTLSYNSFHSVACSGAIMDDITNTSKQYEGQSKSKTKRGDYTNQEIDSTISNFSQGYIDQLDFVASYQPQVITLSVGGNDIGFTKILQQCIAFYHLGTCYSSYEDRLELVRSVNNQFQNFVSTYQTLKNSSPPDTRIYVIGYPQIVKPGGDCANNVQLNADELVLAQQLTTYLDRVIQQAANKAGVYYVDTQNAFDKHRLCEAGPGKVAVNGITKGNDFPQLLNGFIHGPLGNETYHPTPLGYGLLRDAILVATNNLSATMPTPDLTAAVPAETGLEILDVVHSGRSVNGTNYSDDLSSDILPIGSPSDIFVDGLENSLKPNASYRLELHSDPVILGNYTSDSSGNLSFQVSIPANITPGFHGLHIYGTNAANEAIDIYKSVYVAFSGTDYNGNGINNVSDSCVFVDPSAQDFDQDGIDDACDGFIDEAPAPTPSSSSQSFASSPQTQQSSQNSSTTNQIADQNTSISTTLNHANLAIIAPEVVKEITGEIFSSPQNYFSTLAPMNNPVPKLSAVTTKPMHSEKVLAYSTTKTNTNDFSKLVATVTLGSATIFGGLWKLLHLRKFF